MERLLLVDGSNLLFQMFFGMPARINAPDGHPIQGTLGFVGALLKMLRMVQPTHAAVIFDGECDNPRRALDASYKADREDYSQAAAEENPFAQLPDIYRALTFLKIPAYETTDRETDDYMASYAAFRGDMELIIASFDSDYFQLIDERTKILRYRGEKTVLCDRAYLDARFHIVPEVYADFKALTGDSADNIPGVPQVGPKTAAALLKAFGSLEGILAHVDQIPRPAVREAVRACRERLNINYRLIRLIPDPELPIPVEALRYTCPQLTTTQVLRAIGLKA